VSESSTLRVEIADAGGTQVELPHRVADELRALAVDAVVVPLEAIVQTSADAVILRGDAPGVLGILRSLRDDGARPGTPVLLLGTPEGTGPFKEGPGFGAEHVLAKDASASRIAEVLARITGRKSASADPSRERKVEHTLELSQRGEAGAGDWQVRSGFLATPEERFGEADRQSLLPSEPPGVSRLGNEAHERPDEVSQVLASAGLSAVFESSHGDVDSPHRRTGSSPGDRRSDSVAPGTGSHPGTGVSSPGSVPSTSQFFVVASISDELRKILYDADRRVFADRPLVDVSLPRGEDAARDLVPDEFVEVLSLALDEAERADVELTFVGATAARADAPPRARPTPDPEPASDADEVEQQRPKTSPGTPSSISRRPPEPETRLSPDPQIAPPRPYVSEAPRTSEGPAAREDALVRPSQPPSRVALASSERGDLAPLGAFALLGQLALGRLDVVLTLRVQDKPVVLSLARGELAQASGEGFVELRRRALHRLLSASLGAGQATDASRGDASFALERASRLAEEAVLAEVLLEARGAFSIEPRVVDARADGSRLTQRTLASTVLEVSRRALSADRVAAHFLPGPDDPTVSRLERLSRLEVARVPNLERVLDAIEAPRELAWLLRRTTATQPTNLASLVAAAPDEPGLVAAVFVVAQLGGLAIGVLSEATSLAHTDLDARAEKSIAALRERADRADYFEVLGIPRDSDGPAVVDAHYRLRAELLAWPLADLGLARLEADRMRILSVLDDAADVLSEARARRRYARGLDVG
jgi:hypothetical protein